MSDALVIEAVRKTVTVDCAVEEAFRIFTREAISWWPVDSHSINEEAVQQIVFEEREGGDVYELTGAGERGHWATVVTWEPPNRLVLEWNILKREPVATELEVRFVPEGEATRVELEHRGWEKVAEDAEAKRGSYDTGWDHVLARYEHGVESV
jgi:uncharacterized protein YndB with AHSA1/START domain